jgi:uncharacterized repeat protein (TIGR02543 family)
VSIAGNPGVLGAILRVSWDETMTLVDDTSGEVFSNMTYTPPSRYNPAGTNFIWFGNEVGKVMDGVVLTLTFQISETAENNDILPIEVTYTPGDVFDSNDQDVTLSITNGYVHVIDYTPGDVTDDGRVNTRDLVRLSQYISDGCKTDSEGYNAEVVEAACDVNGDGKINARDLIRLSQYISDGNKTNPEGYNAVLQPAKLPGCEHTDMIATEAKAATCTEDGNIAYWHCSECNKYFSNDTGTTEIELESTVIEATGHTVVIDAAVAPTYTTSGLTEGSHCGVCNEVFVAQKPLNPLKGYAISYSIVGTDTYLAQQSIENPNPKEYNPEQDTITLVNLTAPDGYEFLGWYDAPQSVGGNRINEIPKGSIGDRALYAHWREKTYDITYKLYQTPLGAITETKYLHYTVSKGLKDLPNPEIHNYVFIGWYMNDGTEVKEIEVGTTGDITLNAYWTSKRNLAKSVGALKDPIIIENSEDGVIYFTYELGTIENVPLSDAIWTIQNVSGLAQQKSETVSTTISEEKAIEIADTISKSTVDSATWTLSKDWNDVTEVSEEWANERGLTIEEANELTKTETDTYSFTSDKGGCSTTTTTDGTTTVDYKSQNYTHGNGAEFNAKINGSYSAEMHAGVKVEGIVDVGGSSKWEVGGEVGGGYQQHKETDEHTGTDTTTVKSTVTAGGTSWNNSTTNSQTKAASQSESVKEALSEIISNTKGYGKSYSAGGENSESQEFSSTDSKSVSTSSSLTYFSSETKTTTTTYSSDGKSEGCYRLVIAGTVHVFGVVGYDVATQSYFTYTFNVMDDKTYEFLDYSPTLSFNDYQNGALPFEIPYFVHEYVMGKTVVTESLAYITDSTTGTAVVTSFGENIGTKDAPNWVYPTLDVVVPSYIASGGNAYKVTGITANAFAGKPIRSIILSDFITDIPKNAFKDCTSLEQISGRFTTIGDYAFSGCAALEDFVVSARTTSIGEKSFEGVATLKLNALQAKFAPENAAETTQKVIQSAVESGAKNVVVDISEIATETVLTLDVPAIDSVELIGDKKDTYTDLKITSFAKTTKLRNLTVANCTRIPLEIKDGDLILDTVSITAPNFVLLLAKDGATVSLLRDSKLTAQSGNAAVAKNPQIESLKDENVWGSLRISGNFYYCGSKPDTGYMTMVSGELIALTDTEFASYIRGCFKITFNPNGGSVDKDQMTAFVGQNLGALPVPSRTGYDFVGWFDSNNVHITETSALTTAQDITLTAQWSAKAYKVSWNDSVNDGFSIVVKRTSSPNAGAATGTLSNNATVYYGDVLSVTYTKDDYWSITGQGATSITVTGNVTSSTIYATATENPPSGWVKASEMPAGAQVLNRKWSYSLREYTSNSASSLSGWTKYDTVRTSWGAWSDWGTWNPDNGVRNVEWRSVYDHTEYHYYRWINSGGYVYTYQPSSAYWLEEKWFTYELPVYDNGSQGTSIRVDGSGYRNRWVKADYEGNRSVDKTFTRDIYRDEWRYQDPVYTYYYYRDLHNLEKNYNPANEANVSNVVEWVQYRAK